MTDGVSIIPTTEVRPHHTTRRIKHGGIAADIDALIAPLVRRLWKNGIKTCSSCEESEPGVVWIQFPEYEYAKMFFDAVSVHVDIIWTKDHCWEVGGNYDGEGNFSIRFYQEDLPLILKQFPFRPLSPN